MEDEYTGAVPLPVGAPVRGNTLPAGGPVRRPTPAAAGTAQAQARPTARRDSRRCSCRTLQSVALAQAGRCLSRARQPPAPTPVPGRAAAASLPLSQTFVMICVYRDAVAAGSPSRLAPLLPRAPPTIIITKTWRLKLLLPAGSSGLPLSLKSGQRHRPAPQAKKSPRTAAV